MTLQAAKKGLILCRTTEKCTSGAKARVDSAAFTPGLKSRPTARTSFFRSLFSRAEDASENGLGFSLCLICFKPIAV
jgi:hypothetical protein